MVSRKWRTTWSLLASLAVGGISADAFAQAENINPGTNGSGADTHLFRAAIDSKGFFSVNGADLLGANDISLGLILDYGYGLLPLAEGHEVEDENFLLKHSFQGTLNFDYGIANWVVLGISAPVVLAGINNANDIGPTGATYNLPSYFAQGLSYIALHAKVRIIRPGDEPGVGLAFIVQGGPELIGSDDFLAEPAGFIWPQLAFEARVGSGGIWRLGLNGGFRAHFGEGSQLGEGADGEPQLENGLFEYGQLVTAGFGTSIRVADPLDLVAETYSTFLVTGESDSKQRISAEAIGGIKLFIDGNSYLHIGGGAGYTPGFQTATARGTVGFVFEPSIGDRDRDGIKDDEDDCPDQPEDKDGFQDTKSESPEGQYGCPDPDNDGDGILDEDDDCPNNPEDKDGDADTDGCPETRDGDRDRDGIWDSKDQCPDEPEDKDGFEDKDGCPDLDNDKDGIPDAIDACRDVPGVKENYGCPPEENKKVIISENSILILEKVQFATGSAKILEQSFGIIDAVADTLKQHGEFTLVEVQGHADERAADDYNLRLTKDRAKSVVAALVQRGVTQNRLRGQGYGEYCPLDDGKNNEAYEKNRRVEFKIVRTAEGPTNVDLGCERAAAKGVKPLPP